MSAVLPTLYIVRHGETAWTLSGQHTGLMDIPLTERGQSNARCIGNVLRGKHFAYVLASPLERARQTCELAGFSSDVEVDPDLIEWNYGKYQGLRMAEIWTERPGWELFRDGCPEGESAADVGVRADRIVRLVRAFSQDVLIFSHGHFLRVLAARWLGLEPQAGKYFLLNTASLSMLGFEQHITQPVIKVWNDLHHLMHH